MKVDNIEFDNEQQLEDMITIMCNICAKQEYPKCEDRGGCICEELVEAYYLAGYRRQIEGEWVEEHGKTIIPVEYDENGDLILNDYTANVCSICGRMEPKKEPYCNCGAKMKNGVEPNEKNSKKYTKNKEIP